MKNKKYHTVGTVPKSNIKITKAKLLPRTYTWPFTFLAGYRHFHEKWWG